MLNGNEISVVHNEADAVLAAHHLFLVHIAGTRPADLAWTVRPAVIFEPTLQHEDDLVASVTVPHRGSAGGAPNQTPLQATRFVHGNDVQLQPGADIEPWISRAVDRTARSCPLR